MRQPTGSRAEYFCCDSVVAKLNFQKHCRNQDTGTPPDHNLLSALLPNIVCYGASPSWWLRTSHPWIVASALKRVNVLLKEMMIRQGGLGCD